MSDDVLQYWIFMLLDGRGCGEDLERLSYVICMLPFCTCPCAFSHSPPPPPPFSPFPRFSCSPPFPLCSENLERNEKVIVWKLFAWWLFLCRNFSHRKHLREEWLQVFQVVWEFREECAFRMRLLIMSSSVHSSTYIQRINLMTSSPFSLCEECSCGQFDDAITYLFLWGVCMRRVCMERPISCCQVTTFSLPISPAFDLPPPPVSPSHVSPPFCCHVWLLFCIWRVQDVVRTLRD